MQRVVRSHQTVVLDVTKKEILEGYIVSNRRFISRRDDSLQTMFGVGTFKLVHWVLE
jgi:hypothetical protein